MNEEMLEFFATIIKDEPISEVNASLYSITAVENNRKSLLEVVKKYLNTNSGNAKAYYSALIEYYITISLFPLEKNQDYKEKLDILIKECKIERKCLLILKKVLQDSDSQMQILNNVYFCLKAASTLKEQRIFCFEIWTNYFGDLTISFPEYDYDETWIGKIETIKEYAKTLQI